MGNKLTTLARNLESHALKGFWEMEDVGDSASENKKNV